MNVDVKDRSTCLVPSNRPGKRDGHSTGNTKNMYSYVICISSLLFVRVGLALSLYARQQFLIYIVIVVNIFNFRGRLGAWCMLCTTHLLSIGTQRLGKKLGSPHNSYPSNCMSKISHGCYTQLKRRRKDLFLRSIIIVSYNKCTSYGAWKNQEQVNQGIYIQQEIHIYAKFFEKHAHIRILFRIFFGLAIFLRIN